MSLETMEWILIHTMWVVCAVTTSFPLAYGLRNQWWVTRAGKSMLFLSTGVALAWDLTLFLYYWGPENLHWYFWSQFLVMIYTIAAGLYVLYALWYNRRHGQMVTVTPKSEEDVERDDQRP